MLYGLYLSAQGASAQATRLEVIANNLANASTTGFKRDLARFQAHRPFDAEQGSLHSLSEPVAEATGGLSLYDVTTDFTNGPLLATGGTYDVALAGPGFLRVSDGRQEYLTRNGKLAVTAEGQLVTEDGGRAVLTRESQRIAVPAEAQDVEIAADGTIAAVLPGGARAVLGQLDVVRPRQLDQLEKVGHSLYRAPRRLEPAGPEVQVRQGFLEGSGTNPTSEMMQMIEASRAFEMNVNLMRSQDEALGQLLQSMMRR